MIERQQPFGKGIDMTKLRNLTMKASILFGLAILAVGVAFSVPAATSVNAASLAATSENASPLDVKCFEVTGTDENDDPNVECEDIIAVENTCATIEYENETCEEILEDPDGRPKPDAPTTLRPNVPLKAIVGTGISWNSTPPWICQGGTVNHNGCKCPPHKKLIYTQIIDHGISHSGSKCVERDLKTGSGRKSVDAVVNTKSGVVKRRAPVIKVAPRRRVPVIKVAPRRRVPVIKVAPRHRVPVIKVAPKRRSFNNTTQMRIMPLR